ncbi:MAG TPA: hypothetical protein VMW79_06125 [Anaerolineae bacterium]|nr:hypothetical protein [Anaerolineae bacterium]HUW95989.1 hypothetical protein [Anaerolineae bacterium]
MGLWYCTREAVKAAAGLNGSDEHASIDRLLESASREIERVLNRWFYPLTAIRYYPYPNTQSPTIYRYWLDADLLASTLVVSGGVTIVAADYFEEPANYGPPYNRIEIDLSAAAAFRPGDTWQRAIEVTGRWGFCETSAAAGALAVADEYLPAAPNTTIAVTDSSLIGVGDLILIGTERMIVTAKALLDTTTDVDMVGDITADEAVVAITVDLGTKVKVNEVITIDAERMLVEGIAGNILTVRRAYDGSVLASHLDNASVYVPRTLTVERAAVGTTAAEHLIAALISKNVPPGLISELALAETIYAMAQEKGHMTLAVGQGEAVREVSGKGIADVRKRAEDAYKRNRASRAV